MVPVIAADDARVQLVLLISVIGVYTFMVAQFNPWKAPVINAMDAVTSALLIQILVLANGFLPDTEEIEKNIFDWAMFGCCIVVYGWPRD